MKREKTAITLIKFCIPLILSGILQQLYNWADAFIVGNVAGENALAAIGSTNTVINLFLTAITGFTLGLSILFAQNSAAEKKIRSQRLCPYSPLYSGVFFYLSRQQAFRALIHCSES